MLKRLLLGVFEGLLIGGILAVLLMRGLGIATFEGVALAYLAAAAAGALTGLVAGRPIWRKGAAIEGGLKVLAGTALGAGLMFAIRRWLPVVVDLGLIGAGRATIGALPAASLPLLSTLLAVFFELDNTGDGGAKAPPKTRVSAKADVGRALDQALEDESEQESREQRLKR